LPLVALDPECAAALRQAYERRASVP